MRQKESSPAATVSVTLKVLLLAGPIAPDWAAKMPLCDRIALDAPVRAAEWPDVRQLPGPGAEIAALEAVR